MYPFFPNTFLCLCERNMHRRTWPDMKRSTSAAKFLLAGEPLTAAPATASAAAGAALGGA